MFLKKLFNFGKDYTHYLEKGDKYMADEQYAHARHAYEEALEKLEAGGAEERSQVESIQQKIAQTGNMLGRLNLVEAEHAISSDDRKKAEEHLNLILELAVDVDLRAKSKELLAGLAKEPIQVLQAMPAKSCGSCKSGTVAAEMYDLHEPDDNMSGEDRLALFFHSLPDDLPERYAAMGEEFASGCLLKLEGDTGEAMSVFEELSAREENDILNYEMAILHYENGDYERSEKLLIKAIALNALNPLCNLGLVHLYSETGRVGEALQLLEQMVASDVMPEQATLMHGDLQAALQDESSAVESYSKLLAAPKFAKEAAERIIPILQKQGRDEEAKFLFKKYGKGCC